MPKNCTLVHARVEEFEIDHKEDTFCDQFEREHMDVGHELSGIPYSHAYKCISHKRLSRKDFVHEVYSKDKYMVAYGVPFHPMPWPWAKTWEKTPCLEPDPPIIRKMSGRPSKRKRMMESEEEQELSHVKRQLKPHKCTRCGDFGHT